MIYISTGGYKNSVASETVKLFHENGIKNIELSGGLFSIDLKQDLFKYKESISFQVHNYFPPPEEPFVFNLASMNEDINKKSLNHAKKAINWASELGGNAYSFHAGFLIDPKPRELGKKINKRNLFNRESAIQIFINNVNEIADYAKSHSIAILIENNVLSHGNLIEFGNDPLLMTTPEECAYIMEQTNYNVNLLIDVAHLKVSANSLKYDPSSMFKTCDKWIVAYHLSDNNGLSDTNDSFNEESWFWKYVKKDCNYYSIEVYNKEISEIINLFEIAKDKLFSN
tara:strand:+ start:16 stop:867 length:852 start_codon:yes stop_codon:yes gene_type:complete